MADYAHGWPLSEADPVSLVKDAQEGDERAFSELFRIYRGYVASRVSRFCRDSDDKDELVQQVFLKVWKNLRGYSGDVPFERWLSIIARNCAIDSVRVRQREQELLVSSPRLDTLADELVGSHVHRPDRVFENQENSSNIDHALNQLSDGLRAVAVLSLIEGVPYKEIAEQLDIPIGTVMSRLFHARRRMRTSIEMSEEFGVPKLQQVHGGHVTKRSERRKKAKAIMSVSGGHTGERAIVAKFMIDSPTLRGRIVDYKWLPPRDGEYSDWIITFIGLTTGDLIKITCAEGRKRHDLVVRTNSPNPRLIIDGLREEGALADLIASGTETDTRATGTINSRQVRDTERSTAVAGSVPEFAFKHEGHSGLSRDVLDLVSQVFHGSPLAARISKQDRFTWVARWQPSSVEIEGEYAIRKIEVVEPRARSNDKTWRVAFAVVDGTRNLRAVVDLPRMSTDGRGTFLDRLEASWKRIRSEIRKADPPSPPSPPPPQPPPPPPAPPKPPAPPAKGATGDGGSRDDSEMKGFAQSFFGEHPDLLAYIHTALAEFAAANGGEVTSIQANDLVRRELKLEAHTHRETAGIVRALSGRLGVLKPLRKEGKATIYSVNKQLTPQKRVVRPPVLRQAEGSVAPKPAPAKAQPTPATPQASIVESGSSTKELVTAFVAELRSRKSVLDPSLEKAKHDIVDSDEGLREADDEMKGLIAKMDDPASMTRLSELAATKAALLADKGRTGLQEDLARLEAEVDLIDKLLATIESVVSG